MNNVIFMIAIFIIGIFLYNQSERISNSGCVDKNLLHVYKYISMLSASFMAIAVSYAICYFQCGSALKSGGFVIEVYILFLTLLGGVLVNFGFKLNKSKCSKVVKGNTILFSGLAIIGVCVAFLVYKYKSKIIPSTEATSSYSF